MKTAYPPLPLRRYLRRQSVWIRSVLWCIGLLVIIILLQEASRWP